MYMTGIQWRAAGLECESCPLQNKPVLPSQGTSDPDILIVGNYPSPYDIRWGKMFSGHLEQAFNQVITRSGVNRKQLRMTNVYLCISNEYNKDAAEHCQFRLDEEIKECHPKVIIGLGKEAMKWFDFKGTLKDHLFDVEYLEEYDCYFIAAPHMITTLKRKTALDDLTTIFSIARSVVDGEFNPEGYELNYDVGLPPLKKQYEYVVVDVETASTGEVLCIGLGLGDEEIHVIPTRDLTEDYVVNQLAPFLRSHTTIGQNLKYDARKLWEMGLPCRIDEDTMLMSYVIDPRQGGHGLKPQAKKYFQAGNYSEEVDQYIENMEECPPDLMYHYNALDILYTQKLYERLKNDMTDDTRNVYYKYLIEPCRCLAQMEYHGVHIDQNKIKPVSDQLNDKLEMLRQEIYELAGEEFNINSSQQKTDILFRKLGLPVYIEMKSNKDILKTLEDEHPIAGKLLDHSRMNQLYATYIKNLPSKLVKGKLHTNFNLHTTRTGRLSSTNPNLQNIPKHSDVAPLIRNLFVPAPTHVFVEWDISQAELRGLAYVSDDQRLIDAFVSGKDIHTQTASSIFHTSMENVTDDQRRIAKTINFALVYGAGPPNVASVAGCSVEEAKEAIDQWFATYHRAHEWIMSIRRFGVKYGYVQSPTGRVRYFPIVTPDNRGDIERQASNTPIQSFASDITMRGLVAVHDNPYVKFLLTVHDSLLGEVHYDDYNLGLVEDVKSQLEKVGEAMVEGKMPFVVDAAVGHTWGEMEEICVQ